MTIHLSAQSFSWAEQQAVLGKFASVEEYLETLLERERYRAEPERLIRDLVAQEGEDPALVATERVAAAKRRLEKLLLEGLDSGPAEPMTRAGWSELRRRVQSRLDGGV